MFQHISPAPALKSSTVYSPSSLHCFHLRGAQFEPEKLCRLSLRPLFRETPVLNHALDLAKLQLGSVYAAGDSAGTGRITHGAGTILD